MRTTKKLICLLLAFSPSVGAMAQSDNGVVVTGSVQSDILIPEFDPEIQERAHKVDDWATTNTFADVNIMSEHVDAGARFEFLEHPLPGFRPPSFSKDYAGWGVPYFYVKTHFKNWDLTLGNFYEQFGSGFILRTYEERNLGIDNSLLGGRFTIRPVAGVSFKLLGGKQRRYWDLNDAWISGADLELSLDQWFKGLSNSGTYITLGASWVNKYEKTDDVMADATHKLNMPSSVNAFDVRANLQKGGFNLLAEYAWKSQDPTYENGWIYRKGSVAMLSASYSKRGMSLLLQAKRSDNMSFRSRRREGESETTTASYINHLPAFTMDQTYALAAMYPYATYPDGEWAYQAEIGYNFKRHTLLGGKYGTNVRVNFSHIRGIERDPINGGGPGTDGYSSAFWKWGDDGMYYQDINVQIEKRVTRSFNIHLMYMNQFYNNVINRIAEGELSENKKYVHSDIFVLDAKYKFNNKFTLRGELQYLSTDEDLGDWWYGLLELSILPNWMFTIADMYNSGVTDIHYYQGLVTYSAGSHRIQLGYGRTRAGYNCAGGVCRYVPSSKGVTISYNYNF